MNILFLSISPIQHMASHSISQDLLREFKKNGHEVYIVAGLEKTEKRCKIKSSLQDECEAGK